MASKNKFEVHGETIHISRDEWSKLACTTYREDYYDELKSVTWGESKGYLKSQKLGYLHRYIVSKWYGQELLDEMTKAGWVVDHMNNNGFDCEISNLYFLSSDENKAKGFTVDKKSEALRSRIALNMFKDFTTGLFQITIFFNDEMYFVNSITGESFQVSSLKLLYNADYTLVINDARTILLNYEQNKKFELGKLHFIDYKIEKALLIRLKDEDRNKAIIEIDGEHYILINERTRMHKINYDKGWLPKTVTTA